MNTSRKHACLLAALFIPLASSGLPGQTTTDQPANNPPAQTGENDQVVEMSPFVISQANDTGYSSEQTLLGSRSAKNLLEIPGSISIINREMMNDLNSMSYAQVIDVGTAGVTQFQNYQDDMMIRGFRSQSMRNGVINFGDQAPSPLYDVERVEVIKGPAAMLLGTNAFLGGALNYIPRRPTATPSGDLVATAYLDREGKSYERFSANVLGPAYKSGDLSVDYRITAGGVTGDMDKAIESRKEYFAGGALLFNFTKDTSLDVNFYYYENDSYIYYDDFLSAQAAAAGIAMLSPYSKDFSAGLRSDSFYDENHTSIDATFLSRLTTNGNLRVFYSYYDSSVNESIVRSITYQPDGYTLNRQWVPYLEQVGISHFQADYLHHLTFDHFTNDFSTGVDYTSDYEESADIVLALPAVDIRNPNPNYSGDAGLIAAFKGSQLAQYGSVVHGPEGDDNINRDNLLSYYFQDNVSCFDDRLILVAGLRWFYDRQLTEDKNFTYDGNVYATPVDYSPLQTHKWGIVVRPLPWLSLYWTNATNETPQSGFTNPPSGPPVPYGNNVGELTEFGAKWEYKVSNQLDIYGSVAHFNMALTNVYTTDSSGALGANGFPVTTVEDNTSTGLEVEYGMRLSFANSGYADLFATGYRADTLSAGFPPTQASGAPSKVWSFIGKYTSTSGFLKGSMIGGAIYGQGTRYELNLPISTPIICNLFARYQVDNHWSLQFNADNIADKRYIVRIATTGIVEGSLPGTFSVSARYKW